jgi:hypothetical protein
VAERPLRTPFVSQPVVDRRHAQARAQQCAKELGVTALTLIRESMCSTFRANDSVLRVGHFTSDPSAAQGLATMLSNAGFRVPDVIATWQQDETGLGVIAYEDVPETGRAIDWREVGRIVRRLHTDIAPSDIPAGYPVATPTHLPWWNFDAMLTRLEATALVPSQQLSVLREAAERGAEWTDIVETTSNVLTHGDIHPGNILMSEDGPVLIDWDLLSTASPLWDHVPLRAWSRRPWQGNDDAYTAFAAGYGAVDWESDSLDIVVEMRNLAATVMKLIASASTGIIDEESARRLEYWVSPNMTAPWTWG